MKRRTFIKLLAGLPLIGSLPVLAKQKNPVAFDGVADYLKPENDPLSGGFTLGADNSNLTMWLRKETDTNGVAIWRDISGNDHNLIQSYPYFSPSKIKELYKFDAVHTEKEKEEISNAMLRGEPESYFKRFRGYRANE